MARNVRGVFFVTNFVLFIFTVFELQTCSAPCLTALDNFIAAATRLQPFAAQLERWDWSDLRPGESQSGFHIKEAKPTAWIPEHWLTITNTCSQTVSDWPHIIQTCDQCLPPNRLVELRQFIFLSRQATPNNVGGTMHRQKFLTMTSFQDAT